MAERVQVAVKSRSRFGGQEDQLIFRGTGTLEKLPEEPVDMFCVVLVGNSQTYVQNGKMITPRGYCVRREESR